MNPIDGHVSEELPRLLSGDAGRDEVLAAAAHLRQCADCQQELVSAVVAHASLTSAHRFAPEILARAVSDADEPPSVHLPDMTALFDKARDEAAASAPRRRLGRRAIGIAAAVVIAAGAGVTIAETVGSDTTHVATQRVALAAYDHGRTSGQATLLGNGAVQIDARNLPKLDGRHFYEVWLTDPSRQHLQAVGTIDVDNKAQLTISPNVMAQYSAIEVSIQRVNQTVYSGTSVLRGSYA